MPVVIGTAGHIDHGKTSLVRALTGQDTDRLAEEKARGISIDLGFAYLDVADGERAGVVDVPGHERFIRNMLAGAHGMDLVLFTVAADDGVMPQTEEHLDILHLLGVRRGIFVVTKTDLVDAARIQAVRDDVEILAADTTLEGAPIVPVSTVTGDGLPALREEIERQLAAPAAPPRPGPFRLPVDRAFVMRGHGVVVTGTAIAGEVREGDHVRVLPGDGRARVRSLQVHGITVGTASHGQRVAMNLAGIERMAIGRGHVVCSDAIARTTDRFDAFVEVRSGARRALASHCRVRVHVGTAEVLGKVVVLGDRTAIPPREHGWAQVVLEAPVPALRGDRFILRDETARRTLGGGVVVNPFADRHRRGEAGLVDRLAALRDGDLAPAAYTLLALVPDFACDLAAMAQALGVDGADVTRALAGAAGVVAIPDAAAPEAWTTEAKWERFVAETTALVTAAHRAKPTEAGVEMEHVRSELGRSMSAKTFRWCVDRLVGAGDLVRDDSTVRLPTHRVALDPAARALGERLEHLLVDGRFTPPDLRQLEALVGTERRRLAEVLSVLEKEGRVVRVAADLYFARDAVAGARTLLADHCRTHGEISAAVFRDLIGASRKFAIALLDWCDRTGVTTRVGDMRRLRR
jgi:selenocysteine-specific elongation factor